MMKMFSISLISSLLFLSCTLFSVANNAARIPEPSLPGSGAIISSFELYYNGSPINSGEVVNIEGQPSDAELVVEMGLKNVSSGAKNVFVSKEEIQIVPGMINIFCWGACFPPTIYTTPFGLSINRNEISTEFSGHVQPMNNSGIYRMKYTFFDGDNPADQVSFYANFYIGVALLLPPSNVIAEVNGSDVFLSWDSPLNKALLGFLVYRDGNQVTPFNLQNTYFTDADVPDGLHEYCAMAVYDAGISEPSNFVYATIQSSTSLNFTPVWTSPYNPMTFYITTATVNEDNLQIGDEIGIFDVDAYSGDEICVGAGVLTEELTGGAYLEIIASMDDGEMPDQGNGFTPGNGFIFRVYAQSPGLLTDVEYSFPYPGYDEIFASQGSAFVELQATYQSNQHFQPVWTSPYNPMTIYALGAVLDGNNLLPADEIGIFDIDPNNGEEICVGYGTLTQELGGDIYLEMIASMDDGTLPDQANGFTPGNDFIFKYFSQSDGLVENIEISFPYAGYDEVFTSQGNAFVALEGSLNPGISFTPVWTSPYNPMTFYITRALLDGVDIDSPAQIGIFDTDPNTSQEICVGAAQLAGIITPINYLEIIASMDDGSLSGQANGFTPGHAFIFKFISEAGILIDQVTFSFPYPGYNVVFASQGNAIVDLSGTSSQGVQQVISLSGGWAGISSYLDPANPDIVTMMNDISGALKMISNLEAFYQPGNTANSLSLWNTTSGYFIKVDGTTELVIEGNPPENTTLTISQGWNLIPVLSNQDVDILTLFEGNISNLEIIKEAGGIRVFWPEKNIATLISLQPGHAYLVKSLQDFTIDF